MILCSPGITDPNVEISEYTRIFFFQYLLIIILIFQDSEKLRVKGRYRRRERDTCFTIHKATPLQVGNRGSVCI